MSIVKIADEAEALKKIWDSLTGLSIAWEVENKDVGECNMIVCKQSSGTRKGTWDDIPNGNAEECGTQHDTVFGTHNTGGVVYSLGNTGCYFGVVWDDPSIGAAQYAWAYGDKKYVKEHIESLWDGFDGTDISGAESKTLVTGWGVTVQIQPGFDPFKISFYMTSASQSGLTRQNSKEGELSTRSEATGLDVINFERLAEKQEFLGRALLESCERLRKR